ncbi:Ger(x)C family spore germination C-terminal domain-containing protein [Bacillus sp. B6(2022)]|nr:Ger(x)C family spore germination C-terminal domain-containing protein [Bacillus sp. B6(2022)]
MIENHKNGIYEFRFNDTKKTHVVIENIKSHVSYHIKPTENLSKKPHITIDIKLKGELKEFMKSKKSILLLSCSMLKKKLRSVWPSKEKTLFNPLKSKKLIHLDLV